MVAPGKSRKSKTLKMLHLIAKAEVAVIQRATLIDLIRTGGPITIVVAITICALVVFGIGMVFRPASANTRRLYAIAALLPSAVAAVAVGVGGIQAMSMLAESRVGSISHLLAAWLEVSFSLQLGLGGTAVAFTIGAIAFLRKPRA